MAGEPARPDRLLRQWSTTRASAQAKHQEARQVANAGRSRQQADVDEEAGDVDVPPADGGLHGDGREDHRRDAVAEDEEGQAERRLGHRRAELVLEQHQAWRVDLRSQRASRNALPHGRSYVNARGVCLISAVSIARDAQSPSSESSAIFLPAESAWLSGRRRTGRVVLRVEPVVRPVPLRRQSDLRRQTHRDLIGRGLVVVDVSLVAGSVEALEVLLATERLVGQADGRLGGVAGRDERAGGRVRRRADLLDGGRPRDLGRVDGGRVGRGILRSRPDEVGSVLLVAPDLRVSDERCRRRPADAPCCE